MQDLPTEARPGRTADELIDRYHHHLVALDAARRDGSDAPARWLVAHALAALTTAEAIVDDLHRDRWGIVVDALRHGATVAEVGTAMAGLDVQEVRVGLTSWADRQYRDHLLTGAEHAAVIALAARTP